MLIDTGVLCSSDCCAGGVAFPDGLYAKSTVVGLCNLGMSLGLMLPVVSDPAHPCKHAAPVWDAVVH